MGCVFDGIVDQVDENLLDAIAIGIHQRHICGDLPVDLDIGCFCPAMLHGLEECGDDDRLTVQGQVACFDFGEGQYVFESLGRGRVLGAIGRAAVRRALGRSVLGG